MRLFQLAYKLMSSVGVFILEWFTIHQSHVPLGTYRNRGSHASRVSNGKRMLKIGV